MLIIFFVIQVDLKLELFLRTYKIGIVLFIHSFTEIVKYNQHRNWLIFTFVTNYDMFM